MLDNKKRKIELNSNNDTTNFINLNTFYMKKIFVILLVLLPIFTTVVAQNKIKIETDQTDKFSGKRLIHTSWARIYRGTKTPSNVYARITHYGSTTAISFKIMTGSVDAIDKDDELLLKAVDGTVYKLYASNYTLANRGDGSIGLNGANVLGLNVTYKGDLSFLQDNPITDIRINTSDAYYDIELSEKEQANLATLYKVIKKSINN